MPDRRHDSLPTIGLQTVCRRTGSRLLKPHQLRHGGASCDSVDGVPPLEVKARGAWLSDSSMLRYSKPGRYLRLQGKLPPEFVRKYNRALAFLKSNLAGLVDRNSVKSI